MNAELTRIVVETSRIENNPQPSIDYAVQADFLGYFGNGTTSKSKNKTCRELHKAVRNYNKAVKIISRVNVRATEKATALYQKEESEKCIISLIIEAVALNDSEVLYDYEETDKAYEIAYDEYLQKMKEKAEKAREAKAEKKAKKEAQDAKQEKTTLEVHAEPLVKVA